MCRQHNGSVWAVCKLRGKIVWAVWALCRQHNGLVWAACKLRGKIVWGLCANYVVNSVGCMQARSGQCGLCADSTMGYCELCASYMVR